MEKANIAVGETGSSVTIPVELNIAPTTYTIQILSKDSTAGTTRERRCAFKVESYERLPTNLVGTMSFFIAFSIVVATAGTWYDYKKQAPPPPCVLGVDGASEESSSVYCYEMRSFVRLRRGL